MMLLCFGALSGRLRADSQLNRFASFHEAEEALIEAPMEAHWDSGASKCGYVSTAWHEQGSVTFEIEVPESGDYWIWGRGMGLALYQNSFWVSVDGGESIKYEIPQFGGAWTWGWEVVHPAHQPVVPYHLTAGRHEIRFGARESRARLDCILVTDDAAHVPEAITPCAQTATPSHTPSATATASATPLCSATATATATSLPTVAPADVLWQREAEDGLLSFPMIVAIDADASGGYCVEAPVHEQGVVTYSIDIALEEDYYLWGRVMGRALTRNSFWVSVDGGETIKYEIPQFGGAWTWGWEVVHPAHEPVVPYHLTPGQHVLSFAAREHDARVDALLLTSNASFVPLGVLSSAAPTPTMTAMPSPTGTATAQPSTTSTPTPTATPTVRPTSPPGSQSWVALPLILR